MPRCADYHSSHLTRAQTRTAIAANDFAETIGASLNLVLHIHWYWTAYALSDRRKTLPKLLESQRHWLMHRNVGYYSITVRENPSMGSLREHAHQLVHVPVELRRDFLTHVRDFLRQNGRCQKEALKWGEGYSIGKLAYLCKGSTAAARQLIAEQFGTYYEREKFTEATAAKKDQGLIWGKRLYISQSLGARAQQLHCIKASSLAA